MQNYPNDIIIGISTAYSEGAISIIRLSGDGCINLVNNNFKGKNLNKVESHTINYGYIVENNNFIDEVLVSVFKKPKTYTKEDVIEINCHGGLFVTNKIYELFVSKGARPAEPGEFTKRAFLNGRIDLTKAEAVMDMIEAENNFAVKMAGKALQGNVKELINQFRNELLDIIAIISVNIDYPEYEDIEQITNQQIKPQIESLLNRISKIIENSKSAKLIKNGVNTVIIGKPNVGKSSLLNSLVGEKKAIVSSIPGTTRDSIETRINLGNVTLNLIDTAGLRKTEDEVEKIGVSISIKKLEEADFILLLIDGSQKTTSEDLKLINSVENRPHLLIKTKNDLKENCDSLNFDSRVNTNDGEDINKLKEMIVKKLNFEGIQNKDITYISNARQIEKLIKAYQELQEAKKTIEDNAPVDCVEINLRAAWLYLGEITGESSTESLINELFSKFCLGK